MKLTVSRIRCSGCGAPYSVQPGSKVAICPFCDSRAVLGDIDDVVKTEIEARQAAAFGVAEGRFRAKLLSWMASGDYTPEDIFEKARLGEQRGVYLPFWMVLGTFHSRFTARVGYERTEKTIVKTRHEDGRVTQEEKRRKVTDWRDFEGEASDDFEVWVYAGESLAEQLQAPMSELAAKCGFFRPLEEVELGDAAFEEFSLGADQALEARGKERLQALVHKTCEERAPGDKITGIVAPFETRDEVAQASLYPAWLVTFEYEGKRYPVAISGVDADEVRGELPVDTRFQARVAKVWTPLWWTLGIGGALTAAGLCAGVLPGVIIGIVAVVVAVVVGYRAGEKKKAMITASIERRKAAAREALERWDAEIREGGD